MMAFSRSILRMSSWTAASSLWLMVEDVVGGGATGWREAVGVWSVGQAVAGVSGGLVDESSSRCCCLEWMLLVA